MLKSMHGIRFVGVHLKRCMSTQTKLTVADVKNILKNAGAVCFDVDSTVSLEEGVDVLADYTGSGTQVAELTSRAMDGNMSFEDALKARLEIIRPSYQDIEKCLQANPIRLSPSIDKLIDVLHSRGTHVYLVSGGFQQMIRPIADVLGIPCHRIYANNILFDGPEGRGEYLGYDTEAFTCRSGGKARAVDHIKKELGIPNVVMVGDGATDMEARPPADAFIGYGGVVSREKVVQGADWFVTDFQELVDALQD